MGILDGIVEWIAEQVMYGLDLKRTITTRMASHILGRDSRRVVIVRLPRCFC